MTVSQHVRNIRLKLLNSLLYNLFALLPATEPCSSKKKKVSMDSDVQAVLKALKQEDRGELVSVYNY